MERILSVEQMRKADEFTINSLGISSEELVERAGYAIVEVVRRRFHGGRVLVCIGKGNNGADGKVVAKELSKFHGFTVTTLSVDNGIFKLFDKKYDIIIDCIFGTGLNKEVTGKYKTAIEKINSSGAFIISCDIPSGLNGDTGIPMGVAVKANLTVAIQEYKLGHFLADGPDYCGEIVSKDIGISIWGDDYVKRFNDDSLSKFFPKRKRNVHKGCFGKTTIIGGSEKYSGSILLSANSLTALKMGSGYSNLVVPSSMFSSYVGKNPECILTKIHDNNGYIIFDENVLSSLLSSDSIAIGMGVGVSKEIYNSICFLLKNYTGKLIIDADGLNSLAEFGVDVLKNKKCQVILTPHVGEFSKLTGISKDIILSSQIDLAKKFANDYGVILVLKNAVSIITDGNEVYLNTSGTPALAKAGSGDVLSGILAGLLSRTNETFLGTIAGCYLFGKAGEQAVLEQGNEYTVTAMDVVSSIGVVINKLC